MSLRSCGLHAVATARHIPPIARTPDGARRLRYCALRVLLRLARDRILAPWPRHINPPGKSPKPRSSPLAKNILLFRNRKSVYVKTVSPDERGGSRSSRTCGGMRWTRWRRMTSAARGGRRKRVVLAPRGWCQVRGRQYLPLMTVANKPGHRGEHAISRSTTAQGRPDCLR